MFEPFHLVSRTQTALDTLPFALARASSSSLIFGYPPVSNVANREIPELNKSL